MFRQLHRVIARAPNLWGAMSTGEAAAARYSTPLARQQAIPRCRYHFVTSQLAPGAALQTARARSTVAAEQQFRRPGSAWPFFGIAGAALMGGIGTYFMFAEDDEALAQPTAGPGTVAAGEHGETQLINWSRTHECTPARFYQPESLEELEKIVATAHEKGERLRPVGSALSPNGLAFSEEGMVSCALLDGVINVDRDKGCVTARAGTRIADLAATLRPHGLTLQNYASVREQSVAGFMQVSAHGTGAAIPPVDEQVVGITLVTPGAGTLRLGAGDADPGLFRLARCALGALGVVAEATLQCVPAHRLLEHTFVTTMRDVKRNHAKRLRENRHIRYMWIPYTDAVVVVTNNPIQEGRAPPRMQTTYSDAERTQALRELLLERDSNAAGEAAGLSATQLRDRLIAAAPLDADWIARINAAEAEFWRRSQGFRVGWSDEILGFDCGGEQWVLEVAFPAGTQRRPSGADLDYMEELLAKLERARIPAPAPIEQRWSAGSASPLSPVAGRADSLHSWVGIIMYLPVEDGPLREAITRRFFEYCRLVEDELLPRYNAVEHWAKIEPDRLEERDLERLRTRYPTEAYNATRARLDPKNILSNDLVNRIFPRA